MRKDYDNNKTAGTGGVGFCGLLGITFIVLKLVGVISWPWVWVLSPLWIPLVLVIIVFIIALINTLIK